MNDDLLKSTANSCWEVKITANTYVSRDNKALVLLRRRTLPELAFYQEQEPAKKLVANARLNDVVLRLQFPGSPAETGMISSSRNKSALVNQGLDYKSQSTIGIRCAAEVKPFRSASRGDYA